MKDKLIKTNRRATYYRSKKFALTLLTLFGLFLAAFIPVKVLEENPHLLQAKLSKGSDAKLLDLKTCLW
jgi:hypothetical protein